MSPDEVIVPLHLDKAARLERDRPQSRTYAARMSREAPPLPPASRVASKKSPAQCGALVTHSLLARRFVAVTAIDVDVGRAHIAASHWAVPFIRLVHHACHPLATALGPRLLRWGGAQEARPRTALRETR